MQQNRKRQRLPETRAAFAAVNDLAANYPDRRPARRKVGGTSRGCSVKVKGGVVSAIFPQIVIGRRGED